MPRTALVVDDSRAIRLHLKERLLRLGFDEVVEAATAEEGLRLFAATAPDTVFLDMVLPDLPGSTFAREALDASPRARIVLLTALDREADEVVVAMAAGALHYLRKPVQDDELARLVGSWA